MRRQGDGFFFFKVSMNLSCDAMTVSLAAMVSFFAATAVFSASDSLRRVSFSSVSNAVAAFSVVRRSVKERFSLSSDAANVLVFSSSTAVAMQAAITSLARVAELGELIAEFGVGRGDCACATRGVSGAASITAIKLKFFQFFILFPRELINLGEFGFEIVDLLFVLCGLEFFRGGRLLVFVCNRFCGGYLRFELCDLVI